MKTKRRDYQNDGCSYTPEEWKQLPGNAEQAYRRGFMQGFWRAVEAAMAGKSLERLERFCYRDIRRWRFKDRMRFGEIPPDILHPVRRRPKQ